MRTKALLGLLLLMAVGLSAQTLRIYTEDAAPLNYYGPDGKLTGISVEIVQEVQRRIGNKDAIELVPWARGIAALDESPNVLLFSMGRTKERNEKYQWIGPIYESAFALYSLAGSKLSIKSLDDAKKVAQVGVYRGDIRDSILTGAGFNNLYRASDEATLIKMLFGGRLDLIASSTSGLPAFLTPLNHTMAEVKMQYIFSRTQLYVGVSKATSPTIVKTWNDALEAMKKDGTFKKLFDKYGLTENIPGAAITTF